jgi:hypothetical protein
LIVEHEVPEHGKGMIIDIVATARMVERGENQIVQLARLDEGLVSSTLDTHIMPGESEVKDEGGRDNETNRFQVFLTSNSQLGWQKEWSIVHETVFTFMSHQATAAATWKQTTGQKAKAKRRIVLQFSHVGMRTKCGRDMFAERPYRDHGLLKGRDDACGATIIVIEIGSRNRSVVESNGVSKLVHGRASLNVQGPVRYRIVFLQRVCEWDERGMWY